MTTQTLTVELGVRSYPIIIGESLLADGYDLSRHLPSSHCLVVTNDTVGPLYLDALKRRTFLAEWEDAVIQNR